MILLSREEIKNPSFLKDFPFSIYSKIMEKALKFLKALCSKYQTTWDIIIESMYLVHYYCYYKSPKQFFIYDLVSVAFFISFTKINRNYVPLSTINSQKTKILSSESDLNTEFGSIKFEVKSNDSTEYLVNMEMEIYTILNFEIDFISAYQALFVYLEKMKLGINEVKIRKLYNLIISELVASPILICYSSNYLAISVLYFSHFLVGLVYDETILESFLDNYGLRNEFVIDKLVYCTEDIKEVLINNLLK